MKGEYECQLSYLGYYVLYIRAENLRFIQIPNLAIVLFLALYAHERSQRRLLLNERVFVFYKQTPFANGRDGVVHLLGYIRERTRWYWDKMTKVECQTATMTQRYMKELDMTGKMVCNWSGCNSND